MLRERFKTPKAAEKFYATCNVNMEVSDDNQHDPQDINDNVGSAAGSDTQISSASPISHCVEKIDTLEHALHHICHIELDQHLHFMDEVFKAYCSRINPEVTLFVPGDFLEYLVKAMFQLKLAERSNFLYTLAKSLGTQRQ